MALPYKKSSYLLLSLLLLPLSGFADTTGITHFFTPPPSDLSLIIISSIFGTVGGVIHGGGGQLVGQIMGIFCSGIVIAVGAVFGYNLFKLVLHTAQEGEMMAGKGKQLGLVILRSVFGLSLAIPSAATGYCMAQTIVMWLVVQGIGFADQGWGKIVDYLSQGGNIYQISQSGPQDVQAMQALVPSFMTILQAEVCTDMLASGLSQTAASNNAVNSQVSSALGIAPTNLTPSNTAPAGFAVNDNGGSANFGTKNTKYPGDHSGNPFNKECGSVSWNTAGKGFGAQSPQAFMQRMTMGSQSLTKNGPTNQSIMMNAAMTQVILDMSPLARQIAQANLTANSTPTVINQLTSNIGSSIGTSVFDFANLIAPLRTVAVSDANKAIYQALQATKTQGWIVAGAYYPMMGKLSQAGQAALALFQPQKPVLGALAQGTDTSISGLSAAQKAGIKNTVSYVGTYSSSATTYVAQNNAVSMQQAMQGGMPQAGPNVGGLFGKMVNGTVSGSNALTGFFHGGGGVGNSGGENGQTFSGLLSDSNLNQSATAIGLSAAGTGPIGWVTIPPMLIIAVQVAEGFRDAITQDPNSQEDPIIKLQSFGFHMIDMAFGFLIAAYTAIFLVAFPLSFWPSANPAGGLGVSSAMETPLITMFFMALCGTGITLAVYVPLIVFVVWFSAVLGWIGQAFQAMVGAPLVALRLTSAEGEGFLGGAVEGVMMILGVTLTPFLLVIGFAGALIVIKQVIILLNYLFSLFAFSSFGSYTSTFAWIIAGVPAIIVVYLTFLITSIQYVATKFIAELPGEAMRHLHTAMSGHRAAEQMLGKVEQTTGTAGGELGKYAGGKFKSEGAGYAEKLGKAGEGAAAGKGEGGAKGP